MQRIHHIQTRTLQVLDKELLGSRLWELCVKIKTLDRDCSKELVELLKNPDIETTIKNQAAKFSKLNPEIDFEELENDIKTNLFLAIKNEFNIDTKTSGIKSWLISVIQWRTLDLIREKCNLEYDISEKSYSKIKHLDITVNQNLTENKKLVTTKNVAKISGDSKSGGGMHLEFILRKSKISSYYKTILIYHFVFGYSIDDLAEIFAYSSNSMKIKLKKAIRSFINNMEKTNLYTREDLYKILNP